MNNYRVWDDTDKKWLLGYETLGGFSMFGETMLFGEYSKMLGSFSLTDWDRIKLMQGTGLFDKNEKEIYEGDICATYSKEYARNKTVIWNTSMACFQFDYPIGKSITQKNDIEIIGNIYEHPNLLP